MEAKDRFFSLSEIPNCKERNRISFRRLQFSAARNWDFLSLLALGERKISPKDQLWNALPFYSSMHTHVGQPQTPITVAPSYTRAAGGPSPF